MTGGLFVALSLLCSGASAAPLRGMGGGGNVLQVLDRVNKVLDKEMDLLAAGSVDGAPRFQGAELCRGKEGFLMLEGGDQSNTRPKTLTLKGDGSGFDLNSPGRTKFLLYCPRSADVGHYITGSTFSDVFPGQSVVSKFVVGKKNPGSCPDKVTLVRVNKW